MAIRAVLFDAVGTLLRPEPAVASAYCAVGRRYGSNLSEEEIARRFAQSISVRFEEDLPSPQSRAADHATSPAWEVLRWRRIVGDVFEDVAELDGLFRDLWTHFAEPSSWRLYDDVAPCIRSLLNGGLTLGMASNFDDRLLDICRGLAPLGQCPHIFYSSGQGYRKPSPSFFAGIENALGLHPTELLLVGDDLENDYVAAQAAGWKAILLDRSGESRNAECIASLDELADRIRMVGIG